MFEKTKLPHLNLMRNLEGEQNKYLTRPSHTHTHTPAVSIAKQICFSLLITASVICANSGSVTAVKLFIARAETPV